MREKKIIWVPLMPTPHSHQNCRSIHTVPWDRGLKSLNLERDPMLKAFKLGTSSMIGILTREGSDGAAVVHK